MMGFLEREGGNLIPRQEIGQEEFARNKFPICREFKEIPLATNRKIVTFFGLSHSTQLRTHSAVLAGDSCPQKTSICLLVPASPALLSSLD
jgi:hypothetical protein